MVYEVVLGAAITGGLILGGIWLSKSDERATAKYIERQQMFDKNTTDKVLNGDLLRDITAGRETSEWKEDE